MAAIHLGHALGGNLLLGFISAVAFATIIAVVSGLTVAAAAAISHDLYACALKDGRGSEATELLLSKLSTVAIGAVAVILAIGCQQLNVAFMVSMAFAIAASTNFPIIVLSLFWRGLTTRGALIGGWAGLVGSVGLTVLSPAVWVSVLGHATPLFPYDAPALFSMPLAFLGCWLGSWSDRSARAARENAAFDQQRLLAEFGSSLNPIR